MAEIFTFPSRGHSPALTKRQLANHLRRSTRWVELQTRDPGMPAHWDLHRRERRYDLREVETWLRERVA